MGRAIFIAGGCIAGVFVSNPGPAINVTRELAADARRAARLGASYCGQRRSADLTFPSGF
jgi:hypothetical protein